MPLRTEPQERVLAREPFAEIPDFVPRPHDRPYARLPETRMTAQLPQTDQDTRQGRSAQDEQRRLRRGAIRSNARERERPEDLQSVRNTVVDGSGACLAARIQDAARELPTHPRHDGNAQSEND